jgi:hypothetical protein
LGLNVLFLWKPVYSTQQANIESVVTQVKQVVRDILNKVDSFIPKYKEPKKNE